MRACFPHTNNKKFEGANVMRVFSISLLLYVLASFTRTGKFESAKVIDGFSLLLHVLAFFTRLAKFESTKVIDVFTSHLLQSFEVHERRTHLLSGFYCHCTCFVSAFEEQALGALSNCQLQRCAP